MVDNGNTQLASAPVQQLNPECRRDDTTVCLNMGRYKANVEFAAEGDAKRPGIVKYVDDASAVFSDPNSEAEAQIIVVDGCALKADPAIVVEGRLATLGPEDLIAGFTIDDTRRRLEPSPDFPRREYTARFEEPVVERLQGGCK